MSGLTIETNRLSTGDGENLRRCSFDARVDPPTLCAPGSPQHALLFCYDALLSSTNIYATRGISFSLSLSLFFVLSVGARRVREKRELIVRGKEKSAFR